MNRQSFLRTGQYYAQAMVQLLIEPGRFFCELREQSSPGRALGFVLISCGFFALASLLTGTFAEPLWQMAPAFFFGASGMILISSLIGYITMVTILGKRTPFGMVFSLYTFATGITLFVSWLPFLLWLTEPWKWFLVFLGFKNVCRTSGRQALAILLMSMVIQFGLMISAYLAFGR
ncbi:YIP1 family protein [Desulfospira joergensenii]|uniref:YIP1 family protein n=1 Tax=Desulfospira joergensenii TaxID=53329 RepID=UPI00048135A6|nr:YIP1 family protein [Desulfospira joergensenii]